MRSKNQADEDGFISVSRQKGPLKLRGPLQCHCLNSSPRSETEPATPEQQQGHQGNNTDVPRHPTKSPNPQATFREVPHLTQTCQIIPSSPQSRNVLNAGSMNAKELLIAPPPKPTSRDATQPGSISCWIVFIHLL
jgi:hypothetical protein